MALEFNASPYLQIWQQQQAQQAAQRPDPNAISQNASCRVCKAWPTTGGSSSLWTWPKQKQDQAATQQNIAADYKYGKPIDPGAMFAQPTATVGKSSFMPGGQGPVAQGSSVIDAFNAFKAGGMKAADAQPEVGNKTGNVSRATIPGGGPIYPKNASDSQVNAGLFGKRATEANDQLSGLVQQGVDPTSYSLGIQSRLPNVLQSGNAQQLQQIKRNFVSAVLRKESGAAISNGEMANAEQQYFPQAGDSPEVLRQKEINRQTAIQGLNSAAGPMSNPGGAPHGAQPQGGGLPGVGQTFNGGRVLKVTRIQ
jgi:hypothetical protein